MLMSCHTFKNTETQENFNELIFKLMCNSDSSIIVQKLIERGFHPNLKQIKQSNEDLTENSLQIYG